MSPLPFQIDCRNLHFISVILPDHSISELYYSVGHVFDRIIMCNHNNRIAISLIDGLDQFQNFLMALLSHGIDGNAIDPMKEAKAALESYLIDGQSSKNT